MLRDMRRWLLFVALAAGCSNDPEPPDTTDLCDAEPVVPAVPGGAIELGLGFDFATVTSGQDAELALGSQGLWMFIVNARVQNVDDEIALSVTAKIDGAQIDGDFGCRTRALVPAADGRLELGEPYFLAMRPDAIGTLEGARVALHVEARDAAGHQAIDDRVVVAHFPANAR